MSVIYHEYVLFLFRYFLTPNLFGINSVFNRDSCQILANWQSEFFLLFGAYCFIYYICNFIFVFLAHCSNERSYVYWLCQYTGCFVRVNAIYNTICFKSNMQKNVCVSNS